MLTFQVPQKLVKFRTLSICQYSIKILKYPINFRGSNLKLQIQLGHQENKDKQIMDTWFTAAVLQMLKK